MAKTFTFTKKVQANTLSEAIKKEPKADIYSVKTEEPIKSIGFKV